MTHHVYPFRLGKRALPLYPAECEPQCRAADLRTGTGYHKYTERVMRTRDERQCRGCGRWGIWEPRAIGSK